VVDGYGPLSWVLREVTIQAARSFLEAVPNWHCMAVDCHSDSGSIRQHPFCAALVRYIGMGLGVAVDPWLTAIPRMPRRLSRESLIPGFLSGWSYKQFCCSGLVALARFINEAVHPDHPRERGYPPSMQVLRSTAFAGRAIGRGVSRICARSVLIYRTWPCCQAPSGWSGLRASKVVPRPCSA